MVRSTSQANRSDAVAALLNPTTGIREEQKRKGLKPHDHTRDNKQYIKQLEQLNRAREEVAAAEASTPRKVSSKYKHVSARVMTPRQLERPSTAPAARPSSARPPLEPRNFMAGRPAWQANQPFASGWKQPAPQSSLAPAAAEQLHLRTKIKPPLPKQELTPRALGPSSSGTNFLQRNVSAASTTPRRGGAPAPPREHAKHEHHGALPPYLIDRKLAHAAAAAAKEESEARRGVPAGHHVLPEQERERILGAVREGRAKVNTALDSLPFVKDTLRLRQRDTQLVQQLAELAQAENAFSRKTVWVADDSGVPAGCQSTPSLQAVTSSASLAPAATSSAPPAAVGDELD